MGGKDGTLWARGYYVDSVGANSEAITKYVREQENASRMID